MSGPAELAIAAGMIADAGLKATFVLGFGWAATQALRRQSAAIRHAVWATCLATLPVLPLFGFGRGPDIAWDAPWIVGVWAVGFAVAALPIARGLLGLRWIRASAIPDPSRPGIVHTDHVAGPITWGLFRPIIVLPSSAAGWPTSHTEAALAHERAHVARRDWAVHMAAWGISALFWFHPLVWFARRALAQEAEHAADDVVLNQGVRPSDYATLLVSLASPPAPRGALGVGSSMIGTRVQGVLSPRCRSPRRWPAGLVVLLISAITVPSLGAWPAWSAPIESLTCQPGPLP